MATTGFYHPLNIPDDVQFDFDNESVYKLVEQARLGSDDRDTLILGFSRLVLAKVGVWIKLFPQAAHLSDDMVSEGIVAVCRAIDTLIDEGDPDQGSLTSYVHTAIINAIGNFLETEGTIRVPRNPKEECPSIVPIDDSLSTPVNDGGFDRVDMMDMFEAACETEQDRQILDLRIKGYLDTEIADQLGIGRWTVHYSRRAFEERFKKLELEVEDA